MSRLTDLSENEDLPIVFIGRPPHGHSFWLPEKTIVHFGDDQTKEAIEYLAENPEAIVVASKLDAKKLKSRLAYAIVFNDEECHGRIYTTWSKLPAATRVGFRQPKNNSVKDPLSPRVFR